MDGARSETNTTIRDRFDPRTVSLLNQIAQTQQDRPITRLLDCLPTSNQKHDGKILLRGHPKYQNLSSNNRFRLSRPRSAAGMAALRTTEDTVQIKGPPMGQTVEKRWSKGPRVEYHKIQNNKRASAGGESKAHPPRPVNDSRHSPALPRPSSAPSTGMARGSSSKHGRKARIFHGAKQTNSSSSANVKRKAKVQTAWKSRSTAAKTSYVSEGPNSHHSHIPHDDTSPTLNSLYSKQLQGTEKSKSIMVSGSRTGNRTLQAPKPMRPLSAYAGSEGRRSSRKTYGPAGTRRLGTPKSRPHSAVSRHASSIQESRGILFSSSPESLDSLVVFRTTEAREQNPDKLNLENRNLSLCPRIRGESMLQVLYLKSNNITTMCNFENLPSLIFLDLYNNKLTSICDLSVLPNLKVLILGRNRIRAIRGLSGLRNLDVLDLHSNEISRTTGLEALYSLRILSLADNRIVTVEKLESLSSLTELNLDKNQIVSIRGLSSTSLRRVFLSGNNLASASDLRVLFGCTTLCELSVKDNPFSMLRDDITYKRFLVNKLPGLQKLNGSSLSEATQHDIVDREESSGYNSTGDHSNKVTTSRVPSLNEEIGVRGNETEPQESDTSNAFPETLDNQEPAQVVCKEQIDWESHPCKKAGGNCDVQSRKLDSQRSPKEIDSFTEEQDQILHKLQIWWATKEKSRKMHHRIQVTGESDEESSQGTDSYSASKVIEDYPNPTISNCSTPMYGVGMVTIQNHIRLFGNPQQALKDIETTKHLSRIHVANFVFMPPLLVRKASQLLQQRGISLSAIVLSHNSIFTFLQLWEVLKVVPHSVSKIWIRENHVTKLSFMEEFVMACCPALTAINDKPVTLEKRKTSMKMFKGWKDTVNTNVILRQTNPSKATDQLLLRCILNAKNR